MMRTQDTPWFKPRRTMTPPPPTMQPSKRYFVPNIADAVMRSVPRGQPQPPPAQVAVSTPAPADKNRSATESPRATAEPRQNDIERQPATRPSLAPDGADAAMGDADEYNVGDDLLGYSVAEFTAVGQTVANREIPFAVSAVAERLWAAAEVAAGGGDRSTSPSPAPVFGVKTPAAKTPGASRGGLGETPGRKKYFDKSELHHKVLAVLNKVSSDREKYAEVRNELHRLPLPTATDEQLKKIAEIFFVKATTEPKFAAEYAMLVAELAITPPGKSVVGDDTKTLAHRLRTVLVSKCQSEFERTRNNLWDGDVADEAEVDRLRHRYRETLRFVGHLYLRRIVVREVIRTIIVEIFPPFDIPQDYDVDGACALIATVADQLLLEDREIIHGVLRRTHELASEDMPPRSHCLILNLRDQLAPKAPDCEPPASSNALVPIARDNQVALSTEAALEHARSIMTQLANDGDYKAAVESLTATNDVLGVLYAGIGRVLTTPRAEKERQQLPILFRYLVQEWAIIDFPDAQDVLIGRCRQAIDDREWVTAPRFWKHLAQILSADKEHAAVLHQTMLTNVLFDVALSTRVEAADVEAFVTAVLSVQSEAVWGIDQMDPISSPRFRYLSVIVSTSSYDELSEGPLETVKRIMAKDLDDKVGRRHDIECVLFCAMCEGRFGDVFEEVAHHPERERRLMVQKVMGAIVAAMIAMQDGSILQSCVDVLHLVVDGPDRGLREALIMSELVESASRMMSQVRSRSFGFQAVKTLKMSEVISEYTVQTAHRVYAMHPSVLDILGPAIPPYHDGGGHDGQEGSSRSPSRTPQPAAIADV